MTLSNRLIPLLIASTLAMPGQSGAQGTRQASQSEVIQSDKVLRSNTRLVVVDVVVTDSNGQVLSDLKAEDFNLQENGAPQKISNFSFRAPGAKRIAQPQLPPNVISNAPTFQSSSLNVMLLDTLNGEFSEMTYVKNELVKYLGSAQLDRPVALFAMEDRFVLLSDFTTDSTSLKSTVERFKLPARFNNADTAGSIASAFTTHGDFHTNDRNIGETLNQLNALAKTLTGYPGRKNLIWLSESFPINLFPDSMANGAGGLCSGDGCASSGGRPTGTSLGSQGGSPMNLGRSALEGNGEGDYKDYAMLIKKVSDALMN